MLQNKQCVSFMKIQINLCWLVIVFLNKTQLIKLENTSFHRFYNLHKTE